MPSSATTIVLDSAGAAPLTIQSGGVYDLQSYDPGIASKRGVEIGGPESEGSLLVADPPHDNATMTVALQIFPTVDAADDAEAAKAVLTAKLQECSAAGPDGIACTLTKANSSITNTFYAIKGEYGSDSEAVDPRTADGFMRLNAKPVVQIALTRKPFFVVPEIDTVTDDFSTNTIANYTFDTGGGTLSVSGGQLVPSSTVEKQLYRNLGGYDAAGKYYDAQVTFKIVTGASVASGAATAIVVRLDATNYVHAALLFGGAATIIRVTKLDGGVATALASSAGFTVTAATAYWLRGRRHGNLITVELWTAAPTATGTPAQTLAYTLAGADATKFGQGIGGTVGMYLAPAGTDYRFDDLVVEPNVWVN